MGARSDQVIEVLRAAGEPTRLRILCLLAREELAVLEIARILRQSQPRVSRHLKLLSDAGLIERFADGAWAFYRPAAVGPAASLAGAVLAQLDSADPALAADAARLGEIDAERAAAAAAYFAENAHRWDEIRSLYIDEREVESAILEAAGEGPFARLVDLGSGTGRMLTLLGGRAGSAVGLDLSRQMLNLARGRVASAGLAACELRHGDILATGLPDQVADLVVVHQVLHYLADPAAAVLEAARLVDFGGALLIVDFGHHELEFLRTEHRHRRLGFADEDIAGWLAAAGLAQIDTRSLPPPGAGGLTVKIWSARRQAARLRRIA